jgi:hypothetical protein
VRSAAATMPAARTAGSSASMPLLAPIPSLRAGL